jgi:hypothetical protein
MSSFAFLMLIALATGSVSPPASAQAADGPLGARTAVAPTTVVGAVAAIGCGLGIHYWPVVVGGGAGMIAAEIGLCTLALLDGLGSKEA